MCPELWHFPGGSWALCPLIRPVLGDIPDPLNLRVSTSSPEQQACQLPPVLAGLHLYVGLWRPQDTGMARPTFCRLELKPLFRAKTHHGVYPGPCLFTVFPALGKGAVGALLVSSLCILKDKPCPICSHPKAVQPDEEVDTGPKQGLGATGLDWLLPPTLCP